MILKGTGFIKFEETSNRVRVARLGDFSPIGLLLEARCDFSEQTKYPKEIATILGLFYGQFFLIFTEQAVSKHGVLWIF